MQATTGRSLTALDLLRERTHEDHRLLEESLDLVGTRDVGEVRDALEVMLAVWRPLGRSLSQWRLRHPGVLEEPRHDRTPALEHDLVLLGSHPDSVRDADGLPGADSPLDTPVALGLTYVLDGSALGARVVHRSLRAWLPQAPQLRFLVDDPDAVVRWRGTRLALEQHLSAADRVEDLDRAATAARAVFASLLRLSRQSAARR